MGLYVALATPYVVAADNAEFATLGAVGGAAHPSGYPMYVLWLRAWAWLPGTPAHAGAIATAILGGLTVAVVHAACRGWGARPAAATLAVAIVGAAPLIIQYHTESEVFAMNGLVGVLVVWLSAANGPLRGRSRGAALGLAAGLGLSNHLTCVLVAPIGIYGVVCAARESRVSTYALALLGLLVGLLPYTYLFVADSPASWGAISSTSGLIATFLRREYGTFALTSGSSAASWTTSITACFTTIARSWLWVFAVAGVAMLGIRIWRPRGGSRWAWALLAASFLLAGPILSSQLKIDPDESGGIGLYICRRFHMLPTLLLTVPVASVFEIACARISRPWLARCLGGLVFVTLTVAALPGLARIHSPAMERGVANLLRSLPPDAIVVVVSEDQCFGGRYLQLARGVRSDVALICSELLRRDWYRARWSRRGLALPPDSGVALGDALLHTGRPVFVDRGLTGITAMFVSYPFGIVLRVLAPGARPPGAHEIADLNRDLYRDFDLDYPLPQRDDGFAAVAHRRYTASWAAIANLLYAAGDLDAARAALDVARALQPLQPTGEARR